MRSAVLQLPNARTAGERRQVLRAAIRQLDRAELYFDAIGALDVDDRDADRALRRLRADLDALRRHLAAVRAQT